VPDFHVVSPAISIVPARPAHAAALAMLIQQNREHLREFLPAVVELASLAEATNYLEAAAAWADDGEILEWYLFSGAELCGSIRVKDIDQSDRKAKIGYFLGSQFEGKGIMTASVRIILDYCFATLQLNRIELHCAATNAASQALALRLGFTLEGVLRQDEWLNGAFVDQHVYGLLSAEFLATGAAGAQC
jgi:ribosomal-protein-serine acetyltransferase